MTAEYDWKKINPDIPLPSEHRLAARCVAMQKKLTKAERRELLQALGLLSPEGVLIEPTEAEVALGRAGASIVEVQGDMKNNHVKSDSLNTPLRDRSVLPPGLRNVPGSTPAPARKKAS